MALNPANKKTDQHLFDFLTDIGATLDAEQLISSTRNALVDTSASLQGSNG